MEKCFSDLTIKEREGLVESIMKGLPFTKYWVHKTLTEVNPVIHNADLRPDVMYISESCIKIYFEMLFTNIDYGKLSSEPNPERSVATEV